MKRLFLLTLIVVSCAQKAVPEPVVEPVCDTLSEWQMLKMAIAWTESRMNPQAVGKTNDYGVLQITPIYVKEVNRVSGTDYKHDDAFSVELSMEMFDLMQDAKNPSHEIDKAIYYHNKSASYREMVKKNYELIKRYEEVRRAVK